MGWGEEPGKQGKDEVGESQGKEAKGNKGRKITIMKENAIKMP